MKTVFLCSPYSGDVKFNVSYARRAMRDCLLKNEAPFVPHLLYTQQDCLDDNIPEHRELGIKCGNRFLLLCDEIVVYQDHGISKGMKGEINLAKSVGIPVSFRTLDS